MRKVIHALILSLFIVGAQAAFAGPVDINAASAEDLTQLKGIGPAKAEAIIAYRDLHGPFVSVNQLAQVKGIGPKFIEENGSNMIVSTPEQ